LAALKWKASNLYSTTNSTETNSTSILPTSAVTYALAQSINEMGGSSMIAHVYFSFTHTFDTQVDYNNCSSTDGVEVIESATTITGSGSSTVYANTIRFKIKSKFTSPVDGYDKIIHIFHDNLNITTAFSYVVTTSSSSNTASKNGTYSESDFTVYIDEDNYINIITPKYKVYSRYNSTSEYPLKYTSVSCGIHLLVQK
jgi:hypothetical protein